MQDIFATLIDRAALEHHVPSRPLTIPSRSEKPSLDLAMPHDTQNAVGISGNFFLKAYLFEKDNSYLASKSLREMEQDSKMRRDAQSSTIPNPVMDYPGFSISEMHVGKFPVSMEFESWKVNFKTEVCADSQLLHIKMHWIKAVEIAKSINDLSTSRSISGRKISPRCEDCVCLEKAYHENALVPKSSELNTRHDSYEECTLP